jgi:ribosomal protein S18 acetylase RimI-like enzyme
VTAVRDARESDLDAIVGFEIEIARISFGESAVEDPVMHRKRAGEALGKDREGTFVAGGDPDAGRSGAPDASPSAPVLGWVWISLRKNFLTGEQYGFLRSLAVAEQARGTEVAEALLERAMAFGAEHGVREVTGKVHVDNAAMRIAYKAAGFAPEHLTMRRVLDPGDPPG